ncbi:hypothetical protein [Amycolatopsis rubida]|uniref:hypothetical protein n=1 Tax=Amycolatopsis rubida TaxID=112413 RepID=UPI001160B5CE|nr:hypothetical protein [Amycolatopsis rubida]
MEECFGVIAKVNVHFSGDHSLLIAESVGLSSLQLLAAEGFCEAVLFAVRPVVEGENLETSLCRIGAALAVDPGAFVLRGAGEDLVGALEPSDDSQPVAVLRGRRAEED